MLCSIGKYPANDVNPLTSIRALEIEIKNGVAISGAILNWSKFVGTDSRKDRTTVSSSEQERLREELASAFYNISLATDLIEACERHLGPSGWDIEAVAKRASRAIDDKELEAAEMREILGDMKKDLAGALESLRFYKQDQNLTRATMMLGFMVNGGILRIERFLSESG